MRGIFNRPRSTDFWQCVAAVYQAGFEAGYKQSLEDEIQGKIAVKKIDMMLADIDDFEFHA
jgi:hypothetical protein